MTTLIGQQDLGGNRDRLTKDVEGFLGRRYQMKADLQWLQRDHCAASHLLISADDAVLAGPLSHRLRPCTQQADTVTRPATGSALAEYLNPIDCEQVAWRVVGNWAQRVNLLVLLTIHLVQLELTVDESYHRTYLEWVYQEIESY